MSNIVRNPPFLFTYWNPFSENSSLVGSWFDYVKDTSLAKYTADCVGSYLEQTSSEQVNAIDSTGRRICGALYSGFSGLQSQLSGVQGQLRQVTGQLKQVSGQLHGVNQRLDLLLDEAKTSNLLQQNIAELLRIPDSQKQRQHHIELGLKFLKNAALKDVDLYQDALRELLDAEKLMPSDYFVLHRIGMIYLYVPALGNLEQAVKYFTSAGKYAAVESDPSAARLINVLEKNVTGQFAAQGEPSSADLSGLAAESYYKAATALYALGRFSDAVKISEKAVSCRPEVANYRFHLAKHLIRAAQPDTAVQQLLKAIELSPEMAIATLGDFDLNKEKSVLDLLESLNGSAISNLKRGIRLLNKRPDNSRYPDVLQWLADAQESLEKGSYPQKRALVARLKDYEITLPGLDRILALGLKFNRNAAEKLIRKGNSDDTALVNWGFRRVKYSILKPELTVLAKKDGLSFIELVLLATADDSYFAEAGTVRWNADATTLPVVSPNGTVYIGWHGDFRALDGLTGRQCWEFKAGAGRIVFPVIGAENTVYFGVGSEVYAVDGQQGNLSWKARLSGQVTSLAVNLEGAVFAGSSKGLYALNGQTGNKISLDSFDECHVDDVTVGVNGIVYSRVGGMVYASSANSGNILWKFGWEDNATVGDTAFPGLKMLPPAICDDGTVLLAVNLSRARDGEHDVEPLQHAFLYALNGRTGEQRWKFTIDGCEISHPVIDRSGLVRFGAVFHDYHYHGKSCSVDKKNWRFALDSKTGKELEQRESLIECPTHLALGDDHTIYSANVSYGMGGLYFCAATESLDGSEKWSLSPGVIGADAVSIKSGIDVISSPVIGPDETVYIRIQSKVYAINTTSEGPADSPWPMFRQNSRGTSCAGALTSTDHFLGQDL